MDNLSSTNWSGFASPNQKKDSQREWVEYATRCGGFIVANGCPARRVTRRPGTIVDVAPVDAREILPLTVPVARAGDDLDRSGVSPLPCLRETPALQRVCDHLWGR